MAKKVGLPLLLLLGNAFGFVLLQSHQNSTRKRERDRVIIIKSSLQQLITTFFAGFLHIMKTIYTCMEMALVINYELEQSLTEN